MRRTSISIFALALVVASCASDTGTSDSSTTATTSPAATTTVQATTTAAPSTTQSTTTAAPTTTAVPDEAVAIEVASSDLGDILVDSSGFTLYLFIPDDQGDSVCYDQCEATWPPLVGTDQVEAAAGLDAAILGTSERSDGSVQVTYNGWPLYYFGNDLAAGDTNGQGVNDVWFVVGADGEPVT